VRIPPLAGPAEIASMLGVSRQRVTQLAAHPDFPRPVAELSMGKVWLRSDIETWAAKRGRQIH
jgi:predicted DNA-binding transcriptional regulator AlpA